MNAGKVKGKTNKIHNYLKIYFSKRRHIFSYAEFQSREYYILVDALNVVSQRSSVHFDKTPICMYQVDTLIIPSKLKKSDVWSDVGDCKLLASVVSIFV